MSKPATFHPRIFARESGLHYAARSLPVLAGVILIFVGGLLSSIALVAWRTETREGPLDPGERRGLAIALSLTIPLLLGGVYVLRRGLRAVAEVRRLVRTGVRARGRVIAVKSSAMSINNVRQVIVRFRYRDAEGRAREGDSWPVAPHEGWKEGDEGVVAFDPGDPGKAVWIGREH